MNLDALPHQDCLTLLQMIRDRCDPVVGAVMDEFSATREQKMKGIVGKAGTGKAKKAAKPFDMSKYKQKHMALQIQYDGALYHGRDLAPGSDGAEHGIVFRAGRGGYRGFVR